MEVFFAKNYTGKLSFDTQNIDEVEGSVANLLSPVNLQSASSSEEDKAAVERIKGIIVNANDAGERREGIPEFGVSIALKKYSQPTQCLEGSVTGTFFRALFQGLGEQPMGFRLELKIILSTGFQKTVIFQEMGFLNEDPEENVGFRFVQSLDPCWIPLTGSPYDYQITCHLLLKPIQPAALPLPPTLAQMNWRLLEGAVNTDFSLMTLCGTGYPCHRVFLQGCSETFKKLIELDARKEQPQNFITLNTSSTAGVVALLKFIYCRDLTAPMLSPQIAVELLVVAHYCEIKDLEVAMKELLLIESPEWWQQDLEAEELVAKILSSSSKWGEQYKDLLIKAVKILHS